MIRALSAAVLASLVVVPAACGSSDSGTHDAPASLEAGPCGSGTQYAGEIVDWDSSGDGSAFCGVFGAVLTEHTDSTVTAKTPPNGRVTLCIPAAATTALDVTPPTAVSPCITSAGGGTYALAGTAVANPAVLATGKQFSYRMITTARETTFFKSFNSTVSPTAAQLYVSVSGTAGAATIGATHDATQAFNGTTWAPGTTGTAVFFPNVVVPASGTDTLTIAGGAIGAGSVPLVAGQITYVTVVGS